jgi:LDH2 family malate/lactate/ureidoglycolate dehydrogenase
MGILSTALAGASFGTELGNMVDGPKTGEDGHFFLAVDVSAFVEPALFTKRVDAVVRQIRSSRPAPGAERVYSPGELEAETERQYRADGIPLNTETLRGIHTMATRVGVEVPGIPRPSIGAA